MDNYSLEEVKLLIDENKISPEVFNNILKSASRRLELYNDKDDLEILRFLSENKIVPKSIRKEINGYLESYYKINNMVNEKNKKNGKKRTKTVIIMLIIAIVLIIICLCLVFNRG